MTLWEFHAYTSDSHLHLPKALEPRKTRKGDKQKRTFSEFENKIISFSCCLVLSLLSEAISTEMKKNIRPCRDAEGRWINYFARPNTVKIHYRLSLPVLFARDASKISKSVFYRLVIFCFSPFFISLCQEEKRKKRCGLFFLRNGAFGLARRFQANSIYY